MCNCGAVYRRSATANIRGVAATRQSTPRSSPAVAEQQVVVQTAPRIRRRGYRLPKTPV